MLGVLWLFNLKMYAWVDIHLSGAMYMVEMKENVTKVMKIDEFMVTKVCFVLKVVLFGVLDKLIMYKIIIDGSSQSSIDLYPFRYF